MDEGLVVDFMKKSKVVHTQTKPATESLWAVYVFMTFQWTPGNKGLSNR